jgi:hypothetical protein
MKKLSLIYLTLLITIISIACFSCSTYLDSYSTGNLTIVIPECVSLNGIPYNDLEIGLFPIITDYSNESAIAIFKISNGKVIFNEIVPGTYIAAVAKIPGGSIVRTHKTVQIVGGQTKSYNLF